MSKYVDVSELMYNMGKYGEIGDQEYHEKFMHFMGLLGKTVEKLPNKNPEKDLDLPCELYDTTYRVVDAISIKTGETRTDKFYPSLIGALVEIVELKIGGSAVIRALKDNHPYYTSNVVDFYVADNTDHVVVQTINTVYELEKANNKE